MLQNESILAIVAVHTAENELFQVWGKFNSLTHFGSYLGALRIQRTSCVPTQDSVCGVVSRGIKFDFEMIC